MQSRRPGAVKQLLMLIDDFTCQRCHLNLSRFPELIQLHHMIDKWVLSRAKHQEVRRKLQHMRRHIEYQMILCPACHLHVHDKRESEFFFPSYNVNTAGNNVKLAMEQQVKLRR